MTYLLPNFATMIPLSRHFLPYFYEVCYYPNPNPIKEIILFFHSYIVLPPLSDSLILVGNGHYPSSYSVLPVLFAFPSTSSPVTTFVFLNILLCTTFYLCIIVIGKAGQPMNRIFVIFGRDK